jgi:hypothetical protein
MGSRGTLSVTIIVYGEIPKSTLLWNPQGSRREEDLRIAREDRLSKKRVEAAMN